MVATHGPFVVTAAPDSDVFVLAYDLGESNRVISRRLDLINKSAFADEKRALGMESNHRS